MKGVQHIDLLNVPYKILLYKDEKTLYRALKRLYKKYKVKEDDGIVPAGCVLPTCDMFYILFSKEHLTTELISHEVHHLTQQIAIFLGLSRHGDKQFMAILNGHLNKRVTNYIKKKGIQIV